MSTWATRATATTTLMVIIQSSTAAMLITKARKATGVGNDLFTTGEEQAVFKQGYTTGRASPQLTGMIETGEIGTGADP